MIFSQLLSRRAAVLLLLAAAANAEPKHIRGRVLVKFKEEVETAATGDVIKGVGAKKAEVLEKIKVHILELPEQANEQAVIEALSKREEVEFAELDQVIEPDATPNDPLHSSQWHLMKIRAPQAWDYGTCTNGVIIAILDTGVYSAHEDLSSRMVSGWNVYNNNADSGDVYGHGTTTAGTSAAATNNGVGVSSVAWGCWIMPVRISGTDGSASYSAAATGLNWAADHGARVANISYAMSGSSTVSSAARYFASKGGIVTSSAGNSGAYLSYPDDPNILAVGGTDENDNLYSWSNYGTHIDLVAPGCLGATTTSGGSYSGACGTSYSAPIVAGVAALLFSKDPTLTPAEVVKILKSTADDLGAPGWDSTFGAGRVNAERALAAVGSGTPADTTAPVVSFQSPGNGSTVSGTVSISASATDNVGVSSVTFLVDGNQIAIDSSDPFTVSFNTAGVSNGSHTLAAVAKDAAGNTANASIAITVNNADTQAPSVTITAPSSGSTVSGTVGLSASASDNVGVSSVTFAIDGAQVATTTSPFSANWNSTGVSNGAHTLTATARDAAGNSTSASVPITVNNGDTQAPAINITSPGNGATVSGNVSLSASASDNVGVTNVTYFLDGNQIASTSSPFTATWNTSTASNGTHTLLATARDAAGNTKSASVSVTVSNTVASGDTQAPSVSFTSPAQSSTVTGSVNVTAAASDNVGVTSVVLMVDNVAVISRTSSPYTMYWDSTRYSDGNHTLTAKATDAAGNQTVANIVVNVQNTTTGGGGATGGGGTAAADTVAPTVTITSPANGGSGTGNISVSVSASDNVGVSQVMLKVDGDLAGTSTAAPYTFRVRLRKGVHQLQAIAIDAAGNVGTSSIVTLQ